MSMTLARDANPCTRIDSAQMSCCPSGREIRQMRLGQGGKSTLEVNTRRARPRHTASMSDRIKAHCAIPTTTGLAWPLSRRGLHANKEAMCLT